MIEQLEEPKWFRVLWGSPEHFSLHRRGLGIAILAAAVVATLFALEAMILGMSGKVIIMVSASAGLFWLMFAAVRLMDCQYAVFWPYLILNLVLVSLDWLFISGYNGIALPLLVVLTALMPIIANDRQLAPGYLCLGLVFMLIVTSYFFMFAELPHHPPSFKRGLEKITENSVLSLGLGATTYLVITALSLSRSKVLQLNQRLEDLNGELNSKNRQLQQALQEVKTIRGIIPICASCKKIRNDKGYFEAVELYIHRNSEAEISHGLCPDCIKKLYPELA